MTFSGVFTPVVTPFDLEGRLDLARFHAALARWVASPLTGFVVLGSNGEAVLLDETESDYVVTAARESVPNGRPLIVGVGRESTQATIRASKRAAELGADAVLVRTPGFFKPQMTDEAFVRHYTAVADASPVPVLLYNFTALTGVDLQPSAVSLLASHQNIVGMKESGGDVGRIRELVVQTPDDFVVLAGSGSTFHGSMMAGASGGILVLGMLVPDRCVKLYEYARAGRQDEAAALQHQLLPLARLLSAHGVAGVKAALRLIGCDAGHPRPPLLPFPDSALDPLRHALQAFQEIPA